ncbi:MAG: metal ABC transporter permease, partial [Gammaproteobacteria bacterium]|nr:metal ABC transporter permease [Gammaproteobacteria bacterium]
MDSLLLTALLSGLVLVIMTGPLGCFVVWRRMAYFGDTLSHSALLGVVFGVLLGIHIWIGVIVVGLTIVLIVLALRQQHQLADDTLLGILAHSNLA